MRDHRSHGCDSERPDSDARKEAISDEQDEVIELAVLALVLSPHPAQLTQAELTREVADDPYAELLDGLTWRAPQAQVGSLEVAPARS